MICRQYLNTLAVCGPMRVAADFTVGFGAYLLGLQAARTARAPLEAGTDA
jgi:hypothetical protein